MNKTEKHKTSRDSDEELTDKPVEQVINMPGIHLVNDIHTLHASHQYHRSAAPVTCNVLKQRSTTADRYRNPT